VPVAGLASDNNIYFTQTIGETAVEIIGSTEFTLTQGFQQPLVKPTIIDHIDGNGIRVYPNPATDYIIVELYGEKAKTFRIDIINITGTVVYSDVKTFGINFWDREPRDISILQRGFYIISVASSDGMIRRTFKIEKL
jgi:hypothetical protein